jgi:hypothetical protein
MNQDQWGAHRSQAELRKFGSHPCRETESSSGTGAHKRGNETKKNKLERASERKDRTEAKIWSACVGEIGNRLAARSAQEAGKESTEARNDRLRADQEIEQVARARP